MLLAFIFLFIISLMFYFLCETIMKPHERAIYDKDWRSIKYDSDDTINVTEDDIYYACVRAVSGNGLCQYAICMECYDKNKPKRMRGAKDRTVFHSNTEKHEKCFHRLFDLEVTSDPWWCSKSFRHTEIWEGRISGCISCEREFLKVGGREIPKVGGRGG